jgi:quaternary ammonium compound-resistance protein SugE
VRDRIAAQLHHHREAERGRRRRRGIGILHQRLARDGDAVRREQGLRGVLGEGGQTITGMRKEAVMAWLWLLCAGLTEVAWAVGLKLSQGFTRPLPTVWTLANMVLSFVLLAQALKAMPLGTAYAIWTGIGAVGTAALGIVLFAESTAPPRLVCIALIVAGIVGLKLFSPE